MKYYIKLMGILYLLLAVFCFIFMLFRDGQTQFNLAIFGMFFMVSFHVHMLEQTILNNVIPKDEIVPCAVEEVYGDRK